MESIGQLTGGVAHDFNNLLTVIIGNLERVLRQLEQPHPQTGRLAEAAGNALRGAHRAAALTRQLLAFSRRQPLDPTAVDVNGLVAGMSDMLRRSLGERIEIRTQLENDLWQAYADPNQLEGALLNLAVNARDAMPEGGSLTIQTMNGPQDSADSKVTPEQHVVIRMRDTGFGMAPEVAERAFEPFFTTKDIGHGTGLGLSQVYGFAKQSGGHVSIDSVPGEGTEVTLRIPRAVVMAQRDERPVIASSLVHSAGETILLIEDDPDVRAHSVETLRELGYVPLEASDAKEALAIIRREPGIDLLFSDIGLPGGMNGRQLAEEALQLRPRLKILLVTGYARSAIGEGEKLPSSIELIAKPFEFAALRTKLRAMLRRPPSRILVVEDEVLLRMSLVQDLEALGFEVEEAASAKEALEAATGICAAIVDIGLPGMKGDALAAELRRRNAKLPVIIASGYGEAQTMQQIRSDPLMRFLGKPYSPAQIEAALRDLGLQPAARAWTH
jgi:CheY-like chemotaxis protein